MWVKTANRGLVKANCIINRKAFKENGQFLEYIGEMVEIPKTLLSIYRKYEKEEELLPSNRNRDLSERFETVIVEGDYSPSNDLRAKHYYDKFKELEDKGLV